MPHYRVRFFELLNERTGSEYVVFHGDPPPGLGHAAAPGPFRFPNVRVRNRSLALPGSRSITYQPVLRRIVGGDFAAVVMGTHLQFVSNHLLFAASRMQRRRAVLYWGHGDEKVLDRGSADDDDGLRPEGVRARVAHAGVRLKYAASRLPDHYLVYTEGGAARLVANGLAPERFTVVRNTLDMTEQSKLHQEALGLDERALRAELGLAPDSVVLLFVGRIYAAKGVANLVAAVRELNARGLGHRLQVLIIGDGPDAPAVRARATGVPNVIFTGSIQDQRVVARYLRVASAVVIPGVVGLVANHALAHGVPIIVQQGAFHSPELEYLTPGRDSLVLPDYETFVDALADMIDSPARLRELADAALQARDGLSLEAMADAFHDGVLRAIERRRSLQCGVMRDPTSV